MMWRDGAFIVLQGVFLTIMLRYARNLGAYTNALLQSKNETVLLRAETLLARQETLQLYDEVKALRASYPSPEKVSA